MNDARTYALRAMRKAGYEVDPSACLLVQTLEPQRRGSITLTWSMGHRSKLEKAFARFFVKALGFVDRYHSRSLEAAPVSGPRAGRDGWRAISRST